ncbi:unnamed protein product [Didymodactylos carnosus]|uniref:Uncharacterized protein n=1 Tax=Didymodactylos carnosus TaxID=1234261 RepID=A0A8S2I738_9BILA|nr:unnamed protein product [Didymodactylos carnosus]CAF3725439.1 unnamed protein product [Didymodactylos carnosus]
MLQVKSLHGKSDEIINNQNEIKTDIASMKKIMNLPETTSSENRRPIMLNGKNITQGIIPKNDPRDYLCQQIRKVYTKEEIATGIADDERLKLIKEAIKVCYYKDKDESVDVFWEKEAKEAIENQQRGERRREREKKEKVASCSFCLA